MKKISIHRKRGAPLGVFELIAIALGGMVGGGIFTILGISVSIVGVYTIFAILVGGLLASLAAYSYVKLGLYFKDEGATYSFFKKVFKKSPFLISLIGWWVIFGYISTIALYAFTFSSYAISVFPSADSEWARKGVAGCVIATFAIVNILSVRGMGKIEDLMVYSKLVILVIISFVLVNYSNYSLPVLFHEHPNGVPFLSILIVSSVTFVAYEGFQLVLNAVNEMDNPDRNIPLAIYSAIAIAIGIYFVIALGALLTIPMDEIIEHKEAALAAGAEKSLGHWGKELVIIGALLATSSAISGTVFGASRQMAVIAEDGYFPGFISWRYNHIPRMAIIAMSISAFILILSGELRLILEYGSITFLLVSLLMACANFKIRDKTEASTYAAVLAIIGLFLGVVFIFYYEMKHHPEQLFHIITLYCMLSLCAWGFSRYRGKV
ncbi:MAG: amino acid permease [Chlamydiales bacterium]|nr:amino acid permease [Chlamydiales bacterium]